MGNINIPKLGETFMIIHKNTGLCLEPEKQSQNLLDVKIKTNIPSIENINQLWMIQQIFPQQFEIVHAKTCLILDFTKHLFSNCLFLNHKHKNRQSQQWVIEQFSPNSKTLTFKCKSKNKQGIKYKDKLSICQIQKLNPEFQFQLVKASNSFFEKSCMIFSNHTGKSLDIQWACLDAGTHIIQWPRHNRLNQRWKLIRMGNSFAIQSLYTGMYIEIKECNQNPGGSIIQMNNTHKSNQLWSLQQQQDGSYIISSIMNKNIILCVSNMDVKDQAYVSTCLRSQPYFWNIQGYIPFLYV